MVIDKVVAFAENVLPSMGLELVEVQFRREGHGWVLRLFIDSENGINHDDCSIVSREIGDILDVEDIIDHPYSLEVSSPGLERPLHKLKDYERFTGRKARVKLRTEIDGVRVFIGVIEKVDGEVITLLQEDGKTIKFSCGDVSKARLVI